MNDRLDTKQLNANGARYARSSAALGGQYRKFFGASVMAALLLQITIVTDTIIVGQLLGPVAMSGIRVASPLVNVLNVLSMLVGVGGSTVVSICIGKRNPEAANRAFTLAIVLGIVLGLAFTAIIVPFAEPIAALMSSDAATIPYTSTFLRIVAAAGPFYILASAMALLLRADSCIKLSSLVLAVAGIANVIFDLLFMGVLGLGVDGSAYATDLGMIAAVLLSLLYFRWPKRTLRLQRPSGHAAQVCIAIGKNGITSALRMLFACIALLFLNYVVGLTVGVDGIAFLTVCGNIQLLAVAFFSAGGQAAIPMEGVLYGEKDYNGLRLLMTYVFRVVFVCVAVIVFACWVFPAQIISLFVPNGLSGTEWLMRLYAIGFIPLAANYIMTYYYNTIQQRKLSMALTLCENLVIYLPFIWLFTNAFALTGAVLAFTLAETLSFAILLALAFRMKRSTSTDNILLIPKMPRAVVFEASVPASHVDAAHIAHEVKAALDACGVDASAAMRATVGIEEMVANAANAQQVRKAVLFDIVVSDLPSCVQVSMRDNGAPFDPTSESGKNDGIAVMRAVASRVQYSQSIGMNHTIIEVDKRSKGETHA